MGGDSLERRAWRAHSRASSAPIVLGVESFLRWLASGNPAEWLAAVGTMAAFGLGLFLWRGDQRDKRRAQADQIFFVLHEEDEQSPYRFELANTSALPISEPRVYVRPTGPGRKLDEFMVVPMGKLSAEHLAPGESSVRRPALRVLTEGLNPPHAARPFVFTLEFSDAAGHYWAADVTDRPRRYLSRRKAAREIRRVMTGVERREHQFLDVEGDKAM